MLFNILKSNYFIRFSIALLLAFPADAIAADGGKFIPLAGHIRGEAVPMPMDNNARFIALHKAGREGYAARSVPLNGYKPTMVSMRPQPQPQQRQQPYVPHAAVPAEPSSPAAPGTTQLASAETHVPHAKIIYRWKPITPTPIPLPAVEETYEAMEEAVADAVMEQSAPDFTFDTAFLWPVEGDRYTRISSGFGYRKHPITGRRDFHAGIDIPAPQGTPVLAAAAGEVSEVSQHSRLGKYVKILHADGSYTLYGHLKRWTAREGDTVQAGDRIGLVGSTGRSTGPHLDFSYRQPDGTPVNPMQRLADALSHKKLALAVK